MLYCVPINEAQTMVWERQPHSQDADQGKPTARWGRKARDLAGGRDRPVASPPSRPIAVRGWDFVCLRMVTPEPECPYRSGERLPITRRRASMKSVVTRVRLAAFNLLALLVRLVRT